MLAASACGGSEAHYTRSATVACLDRQFVVPKLLGGSSRDREGAINATVDESRVIVNFDRTAGDAKRTMLAFEAQAEAAGEPTTDEVLERRANAVILWDQVPTDEERELVEDCLK